MSKFIDRLEEIIEGAPARMGFGPARSEKTPGLALVVQISGRHKAGAATATGVSPDGIIISGLSGPAQAGELKDALSDTIWGIRTDSLSIDDAKAYEKEGSGVLAFQLKGTAMGVVSSEDSAKVLCIEADIDIEDLRDINALPVDAVIFPLSGAPSSWTLDDLATVARISGRLGKHLLAEITELPTAEDLKVLRTAGINGLVLDVSAGKEALESLKKSLMEMPKPGSEKTSRANAILPGVAYSSQREEAAPEPDEDDDE
ncbi:MAG: hypothetical protein FI737_04545 [SAR202 cluster bacterium]|jgi:hypothetical protein|nr:hypothetical protein [Dehalococcoidia bacterium]MQF88341.1 hypothetical protein [SAR202 cluster bacterium]|tara:strand:+ start:2535 stop:3311 length:777 start_codon:yes stop_codon:yes gene_type:complete